MSPVRSGTAQTSTSYSPDAADHLADGDAHFVQFVGPPLAAQDIPAAAGTGVARSTWFAYGTAPGQAVGRACYCGGWGRDTDHDS